jgi:2-oxoglutarate ferredoxin oxidoreductase subunit alpha
MVTTAYNWASANLTNDQPYRVSRMTGFNEGTLLVDGNTASAMGAVFGGFTFAAWYPITPSSSIAESMADYAAKLRRDPETKKATYAIVQAEDELAAIGMVLGAGWAGARAMTATSGPGISLMAEFVGYGYFAEIPAVIWDVQRMGPSTGLPTRTSQGDLLAAHTLGHGDGRHPVLIPADPTECFEMAGTALDLAERLQTPIFVLSDLDIGMNLWITKEFEYPEQPLDRGKVLSAQRTGAIQGCAQRPTLGSLSGCGRRRHSLSHAARHRPTRRGVLYARHGAHRVRHLQRTPQRLGKEHAAVGAQVRDGAHAGAGASHRRSGWRQDRHHQHGQQPPGDHRGARALCASRASKAATCAYARCRSTRRCAPLSKSTTRSMWSRTTATASLYEILLVDLHEVGYKLVSVAKCDGLPLSARWITEQIAK